MTHISLRYCLVALTAILLGAASWWICTRPSRPTTRLGMRGKKRRQALLSNPTWAAFEPLIRWMGVRVNGVLPLSWHDKLDQRITEAGDMAGLIADEIFGAMVLTGMLGGVIAGVQVGMKWGMTLGLLVVPLGIVFGGALPYVVVDAERLGRLRVMHRSLPNAVDLLALMMSAGFDFPGAVRQLVERAKLAEELREEFEYMLQQLQLGHTRAAVLREFAVRAPAENVKEFAQAVIQAEERGNPVAVVLEIQAQTARVRRTTLAENAAESMKSRILLPVFMLMGIAMELIGTATTMMMDNLMRHF